MTVAGPMEGVLIIAPVSVAPGDGWKIADKDQPIQVTIGNAQSNSPRPFTMSFEIALDTQFSTVVYSQTGIKPTTDGSQTKITLPQKLTAGRTYYWHLRADDGANTSGWSKASYFEIQQPIVIGTPTPLSPAGNVRLTTLTPEFEVQNGASSGPHFALAVNYQISDNQTFSTIVTNALVSQDPSGRTRYTMPPLPALDRQFFWRARHTDGTNTGAWSRTESFRSPLATSGGGTGTGNPPPGAGGPPSTCAFNSGPAVVDCIAAKYPQYLAAGVSSSQRIANMEFLRDRVIESGRCGGLDLAWNLKRGVGPRSTDAIAWRTGGGVEVVDIGVAFDDTGIPLQLSWGIVAGPPGYDPYPSFSCN
ncbi:MAG: hypothetical protein R2752_14455 [Vicinamibacterales bacterium]